MGERSLQACLEEQLNVLREAARMQPGCGSSLQTWYDDGANLKYLACHDESEDASVTYAWGYLNGCADHCDLTVMEYLDQMGLSFDDDRPAIEVALRAQKHGEPKAKRKKARTK